MKRHEWILVIAPLFFVVILDQLTKEYALQVKPETIWLGFIGFSLHFNPGAMLGMFSELPAVLRVVSLSTGGAFLFCLYVAVQYLLPTKSKTLRIGLSLLLGGILGNVVDRVVHGQVTDFIFLHLPFWSSPVFNLADAIQWIGYGALVYAFIKEGHLLWPENDARKKYWIKPRFQIKVSVMLASIGLGFALIAGVFAYTYFKVTMTELIGQNPVIHDRFLFPFLVTFATMTLAIAVALFIFGKTVSHKMAGPVYAFERYVEDLLSGKDRNFKLRAKDDFKELEILAQKIQDHLKQKPTDNP